MMEYGRESSRSVEVGTLSWVPPRLFSDRITPELVPVDRSTLAGIRNPSQLRSWSPISGLKQATDLRREACYLCIGWAMMLESPMATNIGRRRISDHRESARHYAFAADRGYAEGRRGPGILCADGRDTAKDDREAARLYKLAADQGNAVAQVSLGVFYENGLGGLLKDDREAARLYKLAADQGNATGQAYLGVFYETGRGGLPKDDREAARLYKRAADQGNAAGQAYLGMFYEQGRGGLPKDDREAARLFKLAADQGNAYAQAGLKRLAP
jgi:Sel1 repeat